MQKFTRKLVARVDANARKVKKVWLLANLLFNLPIKPKEIKKATNPKLPPKNTPPCTPTPRKLEALAVCPGSDEPLAVVTAEVDSVKANGARGDIRVWWDGNPTFPVTLTYSPDSCSVSFCLTVSETFEKEPNKPAPIPLVYEDVVWCVGSYAKAFVFDYSIVLQDKERLRSSGSPRSPTG